MSGYFKDHIKLQLMVAVLYSYPFYFTVVLSLHLKQYLFQNKLQRTGLDPRN